MSVTPPTNLSPNSAPWGRSVNSDISNLKVKMDQQVKRVTALNRQLTAQIDQLNGLGNANLLTSGTVGVPVSTTTGNFSTSLTSLGARTNTLTASPVALYIDTAGRIGISASTRARKNVTGDYKVDMQKFLAIGLKNWAYIADPGSTGMGPIADDLDAAGLTEFVIYNLDGSIQGVRTDMLLIGLWSAYVQSRTNTLARVANQVYQTQSQTMTTVLAVNQTKQYPIVWATPFADTNYMTNQYVYTSAGVNVTGALVSPVPGTKTATGITLQVTAGVALLANQTLTVEAIHI
jgi:hypothetical protein